MGPLDDGGRAMVSATLDRRLRLVLGGWASLVFAALWLGAAANLASGGQPAADAWAWQGALPAILAIPLWVALLPIGVGLWASQAGVPAIVGAVVVSGLVVWTGVAWGGLALALSRTSAGR